MNFVRLFPFIYILRNPSMRTTIPGGVWPTMITPFTDEGKIDFPSVETVVNWYIEQGCAGIFAVCQSSEMFFLSPQEKIDIAACVRDVADGRVAVVASGHTADSPRDQRAEIAAMARLGLDAVVLVSNRLAKQEEPDCVFIDNVSALRQEFPEVNFGLYECPYPYKRLVTADFLRLSAQGGGVSFIKDTCCDPDVEKERIGIVAGSEVCLFNANTATLLSSLREGYKGYNGIMANYHPDLYVWLYENHRARPEEAEALSRLLTIMAMSEARCYPVTAKYHFAQTGIPMSLFTRSSDPANFNTNDRLGIDAMIGVENEARKRLHLPLGRRV